MNVPVILNVLSALNIYGPSGYAEPQIWWPGGRGIMSLEVADKLGATAKITIANLSIPPSMDGNSGGWTAGAPRFLKVGGPSYFDETGNYEVDLPPCFITFQIQVEGSDYLMLSDWQFVRIP